MNKEGLDRCKRLADKSNCKLIHFGSFIVDEDGYVIGEGYNRAMMPEVCCLKDKLSNYKVGKNPGLCTAMHAEQMAIAEALMCCDRRNYDIVPEGALAGCILYIAGWYPNGTPFRKTGEAGSFACTVCARWIKYVGIEKVVTVNRIYTADEALQSAVDDILEKIKK